jgi:two-component system C4-dicarboxylate transport sensor histidine kinase DctB
MRPAEADNVRVDRVHPQQVVMNLISNAAEALREAGGGRIAVSAVLLSEDEVEVRVSNDGPGIPDNIRDYSRRS